MDIGPSSFYESKLIYYKKGNEEWGTPIDSLYSKKASSVNEINKKIVSEVYVYPNPSNGIFEIKADKNISLVKVYDMFGRLLASQNLINSMIHKVDLSLYPKGMYQVQVLVGEQMINKKFMVVD